MLRKLVLTTLFTLPLFAQAPHPLTAELEKARLPVVLKDGKLSGAGAELLLRELATTQFFLVGEEHATAEIARFAKALLEPAWKNGYRHVVIEVSPDSLSQFNNYGAIEAYLKRYPWSLPFLSWKEEAEFYGEAMRLGGGRADTVWGVDQEFILSGTPDLERLVALAKDDASRVAATKLLERSRAGDAEMLKTKSPASVFLISVKPEELAALRATFRDAEALRLIDALEESREIYALNATSGWESNQKRSQLMKRLFAESYASAVAKGEAKPKVFVKLGATHTMRGRSMTGVFDLGNLLPELAAMNGTRSFQVMVLPRSGFVNAHRPFSPDDADKRAAYDPAKELPFDAKPLFDAASATEWSLFDLRSLRVPLARRQLEPLEQRFKNVLWGYDAILVIPDVTPSTLFE